MARLRAVERVIPAISTVEGGGFPVRRPFPVQGIDHFDPLLLIDEMGPVQWNPNEAIGAPDHPHRGFETVTYLLAGELVHRDSGGHTSTLQPGDVQWMTAGAGVIHSEMPAPSFRAAGGRMHGFQVWVNLPRKDKMMRPRYQEIPAQALPTVTVDDGRVHVRIVAGELLGHRAVIDTVIPILYLHTTLQPGGGLEIPVPEGFNVLAYCFDGEARSAEHTAPSGSTLLFASDGQGVELGCDESQPTAAEVLVLGGMPIGEPVARYGPFVMNNSQEIMRAIRDYQSGRFGRIPPGQD